MRRVERRTWMMDRLARSIDNLERQKNTALDQLRHSRDKDHKESTTKMLSYLENELIFFKRLKEALEYFEEKKEVTP